MNESCIYCGAPRGARNRLICGTNRDCYRRLVSDRMKNTLGKHGGNLQKFIKKQNWTQTAEGRRRLREMALSQGRNFTVRGGTGTGLTKQQKTLSEALGWQTEFIIRTHAKRHSGIPTCYWVDIANPERCIAVEVDGASHRNPDARQRDQKKDSWLTNFGWKVIRFKNKEVDKDLGVCVSKVLSLL